jgi:uncharacterized membrane protein
MEYMSHYMPYTGEAAVGGVDRLHSPVRNKVLQMFGNQVSLLCSPVCKTLLSAVLKTFSLALVACSQAPAMLLEVSTVHSYAFESHCAALQLQFALLSYSESRHS